MKDFKGRHFRGEIVLWAERWCCRYAVSYRDLEAMMTERGVAVDHSTIYRWVQRFAPEMEKRLRWQWRRPGSGSWRIDETYVKVRGKWAYRYRALDSSETLLISTSQRPATPRQRSDSSARSCPAHEQRSCGFVGAASGSALREPRCGDSVAVPARSVHRPDASGRDRHATRRLRQWRCRKHKVRFGEFVRFSDARLHHVYQLTRLAPRTASFPTIARSGLVKSPTG